MSEGGNLTNNMGTFENYGILQIASSANVLSISSFVNEGFASISNNGNFVVAGGNVSNSGTFVNLNQLEVADGASIDILNGGILNNTGHIVNNGNITNGYGGSLLVANGELSNYNYVELKSGSYTEVDAEFYNNEVSGSYNFILDSGATLIIGGGLLINAGGISSAGGIQLDSTGSISNYGILNNTGDIDNAGVVTNICNGTLIGSGSINSNPLSQACSKPAIKYPASGEVTYNGTLTINGTSNPLASITIFSGKKQIGVTLANSTGYWSFTTSELAPGNYSLTAIASGVDGNSPHSKAVKIDLVL